MIGKRLGGRYEINTRVGGGGMAIVYSGHDLLLDRTVAIKVLRSQYGTDEDFIRRFRREAQAAAKLTHPNVVNIYDVGQEEDTHYIVMEYVEGETLKDLIKREAPLPAKRAVDIAIQIAEALDNAHLHQIIHRDIKPHNILIGKNGSVKVTDFGIARAVTSATITHTGSVLGSVHYFSPEQAKGGLTGEKSDIYSLGVVLYEMVTGELPFSGESPISVALKHLQEDFSDPRSINPELPQSVENVILRALSKDPEQRYQSAREMVKDLETCFSAARINEAKFQPAISDSVDDPTLIIPAIRGESVKKHEKHMQEDYEQYIEEESWDVPQRENRWIKPVVWLIILGLIVGLGFYLVKQIQSMFEVPEVVVPPLETMYIDDARDLLKEKGLEPKVTEIFHDQVEKGYVIKQEPKDGTTIKSGTLVVLTVSKGKEKILMPDVTHKPLREAQYLLDMEGFKNIKIEQEHNEDIQVDSVIRQNPPSRTDVTPKDTPVTLTVSLGGETFPMPSLIGLTLDQVKATLLKYGLELDPKIVYKESYFKKGFVINQWPSQPGEPIAKGTKITVDISSDLKADALTDPIDIPIIVEAGKETDVEIRISDARYNDYTIFHKIVREIQFIEVEVILSPSRNATITVYHDGIEMSSITRTYEELLEDD